ncbi:MAG: hypothetical protein HQL56_04655 [Magnetococcales bacterium]|nr:hypothetical protein [Magnetococcales bacterium]
MRWLTGLLALVLFTEGVHAAGGPQEYYAKDPFTVRIMETGPGEKVCKLEIAIPLEGLGPALILALFPNDDFFTELFTERRRVGLARNQLEIRFDQEPARTIAFKEDEASKDNYWRWQYLEKSDDLLSEVKRRNVMRLNFSNGQRNFEFEVKLTGSLQAVNKLQQCQKEQK